MQTSSSPSGQTTSWPWAILLCKFSDLPAIPESPQFYQDLYTRNGTGGVCDYWREVTFGTLDLTQSQVFGWFTMTHSSSELASLQFPGDRWKLVQWGIDTAKANSVDLSPFKTILVVQNWGVDHGFAGNGVVIIHSYQNPTWVDLGFTCHEMGHGFLGPQHSWSANPDTEYGDGWDIMSWDTATSLTSDYQTTFEGTSGKSGPGLNARNVEALGAVQQHRIWSPPFKPGHDLSAVITLGALNQPPSGDFALATIPPGATDPARASGSTYTVEFRRKVGPDQGIPRDTVLIHEIRTNGVSYLQPTGGSQFGSGEQFVTPDTPVVVVQVMKIDSASQTATVWIHLNTSIKLSVGQNADGRLELFLVGLDNQVYHNWQTSPNTDTWSGWYLLGPSAQTATSLVVEQNANGALEVFALGTDEYIYHNYQTDNWIGWSQIPGGWQGKALSAGRNADGRLELFLVGLDNQVYHNWQTSPNTDTWSGWNAKGFPSPVVTLSPTDIGFGNIYVGDDSPDQTVTLTNTGSVSLTITSISLSGKDKNDFAQTNTCTGAAIAPGGSCTVSVNFSPSVPGSRSASLTFTDNASDSPQEVSLGGRGLKPRQR